MNGIMLSSNFVLIFIFHRWSMIFSKLIIYYTQILIYLEEHILNEFNSFSNRIIHEIIIQTNQSMWKNIRQTIMRQKVASIRTRISFVGVDRNAIKDKIGRDRPFTRSIIVPGFNIVRQAFLLLRIPHILKRLHLSFIWRSFSNYWYLLRIMNFFRNFRREKSHEMGTCFWSCFLIKINLFHSNLSI